MIGFGVRIGRGSIVATASISATNLGKNLQLLIFSGLQPQSKSSINRIYRKMAQFGELVLVIGDLHMPQRAADIPAKVRVMSKSGINID